VIGSDPNAGFGNGGFGIPKLNGAQAPGGLQPIEGTGDHPVWKPRRIPVKKSTGATVPGYGAPPTGTPAPQQGVNYSTFGTFQQPQYISDNATQSVVNNQLAQGDAAGDVRWLMKQLSQPGRSAGKGADYLARVQGAATQSQARNDAATTEMNDSAQNSKMRTDYEYARELEGQKLGQLQFGLGQANWANQFNMFTNAARQLSAQQQAKLNVLGPLMEFFNSNGT